MDGNQRRKQTKLKTSRTQIICYFLSSLVLRSFKSFFLHFSTHFFLKTIIKIISSKPFFFLDSFRRMCYIFQVLFLFRFNSIVMCLSVCVFSTSSAFYVVLSNLCLCENSNKNHILRDVYGIGYESSSIIIVHDVILVAHHIDDIMNWLKNITAKIPFIYQTLLLKTSYINSLFGTRS